MCLQAVTFEATATGLTQPTYDWDFGDGTAHKSGEIVSHTYASGGTYTVIMTVSESGSSAQVTKPVVVPTVLTASAGPDRTIIKGQSVTIGGSPTANGGIAPYTYSWLPVTGLNDPSAANPTASPTITTPYMVFVTDSMQSVPCVAQAPVLITVGEIDFTPTVKCLQTVDFEYSYTNLVNPVFTWDFGDGATQSSAGAQPQGASQTVTHVYATGGTYTVVMTVTAQGLAQPGTVSKTITVPTSLAADAGPDHTILLGKSVVIGGTPTASNGVPPYTYSWTPTTGLDDPAAANPIASPTATTTYKVTVIDSEKCPAEDICEIKVSTIDFDADVQCLQTVAFTGDASPNLVNPVFTWNFGDGKTETGKTKTHIYDAGDTYTVTLTVTDDNGFSETTSQSVTVPTTLKADAGPDKAVKLGDSVVIGGSPTASNGVAPYTYSWSPTTYLNDPNIANPTVTPTASATTTYTVTVTDDAKCIATDPVEVRSYDVLMNVDKSSIPERGPVGTSVEFPLKVDNVGSAKLTTVKVTDLLPKGLTYDASKSTPPADTSSTDPTTGITTLVWNNVGPLDALTGTRTIHLGATIDGNFIGQMTNVVDVLGTSEFGEEVPGSDTAIVTSYVSSMTVEKTANPNSGPVNAIVTFNMKVTNTGTTNLITAQATDILPNGLSYVEATPAPDSTAPGPSGTTILIWNNVGPLAANGGTANLVMKAKITGTVLVTMTNRIDITAQTEYGEELKGHDTADVILERASITVTKDAYPDFGLPGTVIEFPIVVKNDGTIALVKVSAIDTLPEGLDYLEDDHGGVLISPGVIQWSDLEVIAGIASLPPGGEIKINLKTVVTSKIVGDLDNVVYASGVPVGGGEPVEHKAEAKVSVKWFGVSKTSDKKVYRPGEEITYTITVCNQRGMMPLEDVIVKDVFKNPGQVEIVATYPETSEDGLWHIGNIGPGTCEDIIVVARTPKVRTTFDLEQSVKGKGFVNVNNDLSTAVGPYAVENCVYVEARIGDTKLVNSTCAGVTIDDTGTQLQTREHGSGDYDSEEMTNLKWENRSIKSLKNVSASYAPTTFELPGNKAINYDSKWTEESRAKNHITGSVMHETYRYATDVNRDSYVKMDENGSRMVVDASFTGKGSIGFFKKATPDAKPKVKPIFESQEDYTGQFSINESFDEYGKNVVTTKAASGEGFVASDKRIRDSQRTYESGTGSYKSEEIVDTFTNYIAKDIEVAHKSSSYNYSPTIKANQDMKWNEGMWSKSGKLRGGVIVAANDSTGAVSKEVPCNTSNKGSAPATLISEKFSSLEYLKKDSVALGLNEMKTNATFNGVADFRAASVGVNGTDAVDNEERYAGEFSLNRHILMTGVSKYDYPHITVTKEGTRKSEWFNRINSTIGDYIITITNDGNRALAPIYVVDFFPPGTQYISSSVKPTTLTATTANWTILHLGIGNSLSINLKLNITENAPDNVLNCVQVSGVAGSALVSSTNCTSLDTAWLGCCESKVSVEKNAVLDSMDPTVVHYTIMLRNNANSNWAAKVTDQIPVDMTLLDSSVEPYSRDPIYIAWNFANLQPDELVTIEYSMRAARNGAYTNKVHVDASAVDGSGSGSADAYAYIDVRGTGVAPRTLRYDDWQPPDWDLNTSDEGITI
jgi:uncharacterized repeat protein (TIGR01451 family)